MATAYGDGKFNVDIVDVAFTEDEANPPQIVIRARIMEECDPTTGDWHPCLNQWDRTIYLRYSEEYKDYILAKLRGAGWEGTDFSTLKSDMVGKSCVAVNRCRIATKGKYQGQEVEGWDLFLPPRESKPLESKPAVARKLNALFGKVLKDSGKPAPAPVAVTNGAPPEDDEVPF